MDKKYLRSGDKGIIKFRFMKKPEFMHVGDTILFREGRTRGKGKITKIFPIDLNALNKDKKPNANKKQQPKVNEQNNTNNNVNTANNVSKKGRRKKFKNNNNQNQNNQNQENQNPENQNKVNDKKNPPKKKEG